MYNCTLDIALSILGFHIEFFTFENAPLADLLISLSTTKCPLCSILAANTTVLPVLNSATSAIPVVFDP